MLPWAIASSVQVVGTVETAGGDGLCYYTRGWSLMTPGD